MHKFKWLSLIALLLLFIACGKSLPDLEGLDARAWKDDRNGCDNKRSSMIAAVKQEKDKLLALDEMQIVKLLGKPDRNELFKRNQKFFLYFIDPAPECVPGDSAVVQKLVIRFNAMGLAKEVAIE